MEYTGHSNIVTRKQFTQSSAIFKHTGDFVGEIVIPEVSWFM